MTALIYKAALPTYTSAEALTADAGETLLLNDAGTAYELLPAGSAAAVRYLTAEEATASKGDFTIAANPDIASTTSGVNVRPVFDTLVGDSALYEIAVSPEWQAGTPRIKTPGLYRITIWNAWAVNTTGTRFIALEVFDEAYVSPYQTKLVSFPAGGWNPILSDQLTVWNEAKPVDIGVTLVQYSGTTLSANGIHVELYKLAEFL